MSVGSFGFVHSHEPGISCSADAKPSIHFSRMSCIFCVKDIVSFSVCNFQGTYMPDSLCSKEPDRLR